MASPLTLVLISTVLCTGGATVLDKFYSAPFSFSQASNSYQYSHNLSCPQDRNVFIQYVENGYKQRECQCDEDQQCCQSARYDCLQDMSPDILQKVTLECWDKSKCRPLVTKPKDTCWKNGVEFQWPTYSKARYFCVPGDTVVDMTQQTLVSGAQVTVRALPAGLPHSHTVTCSVETLGGREGPVHVSAVLGQGRSPLSTLSVGTWTLGSQNLSLTEFAATTPLHISLQQPADSSLHYAWVWIAVLELPGQIRVSCGHVETTPSPTAPVSETARANTVTLSTFRTDAVTAGTMTSQSSDGETSTSVPVSTSGGGREQQESDTEDTMPPGTAGPATLPVVGLVVGLVGLVVVLVTSLVFFLVCRRRQSGRGAGQEAGPDQGGHIVLADLATPRPDVTYESLRTEGGYQRLALPGDVISAGQHDYDYCDVTEENPYDVIKPSYINKDVTSAGQDYDCDVVDVIEEDPNDVSRVERGQGAEEAPYDVMEPSHVNEDLD